MKEKIFCIGFSKTGTTSIENALEILDYNVCKGSFSNNYTNFLLALSVNNDYKELIKMTKYWDAFADGPWGGSSLYKELTKEYPAAFYIHSIRESEDWYNSLERMFLKFSDNKSEAFETFYKNGRYGSVYFFKKIFNIENLNNSKEIIIKYYNDYNNEVSEYFKSNPTLKYLKHDFTKTPRWDELCQFLQKSIPDKSFPHLNKGV